MKIILFILTLASLNAYSQLQSYRFKADVSIKEKLSNGQNKLTMGSIYYDKLYKKIVYKLNFPNKETNVIQDSTLYIINSKNEIISTQNIMSIADFTVFHLALTGHLTTYGLQAKSSEAAYYKITKVEKTDKGVLSTWEASNSKLKKFMGPVKMLNVNKKLDAMIFYDTDGKILSKQYFKKYTKVKDIDFPTEIVMMTLDKNGKENLQMTSYKNIVIDENNEDEIYRYKLPIRNFIPKHK